MIIKNIQSYHVKLPIKVGAQVEINTSDWSIKSIDTMNHLLVRIETECGLFGWGEAFAFKGGEALGEVITHLIAPSLIGSDASDIKGLNQRLQFENHLWGRYGLTMFAISAIDIALWDLAGKRAGKPLYELLGGKQNNVTAYASLTRYGKGSAASRVARKAVSEGYKCIKLHEASPECIGEVRQAIGPDIGLMVDTNCAWSENEAIENARAMKPLNLMFIEEPIFPPEDFKSLARVQIKGCTPIAAGECASTAYEFKQMLDAGAVSYVQPSVSKVGGITEFLKIIELAKAYNIKVIPHSPYYGPGYLATLHILSALQPSSLLERLYFEQMPQDIFGPSANPQQGRIAPPRAPGLGLEPINATIEKYKVN